MANTMHQNRSALPLRHHGSGLKRPECVLAHASGLLFAADWTGPGGVSIIDPASGAVRRHLARDGTPPLKPNGILLEPTGAFLLTRLGAQDGGVFRLFPDGSVEPVLMEVDGVPLPPTNFVAADRAGRLYVTVSTRQIPRERAANPHMRDGFIALLAPGEPPRIVADDLGYTNECLLSADGTVLYVNETFGRATRAFPVAQDGSLGTPRLLAQYGSGIYPDGLALDAEGGLVMVSIISNTVVHLRADGTQTVLLDDRDEARVATVEDAFQSGTLSRAHLDLPHHGPLKNISSVAFGGPDMRTAYFGCLLGDDIVSLALPVAGARPLHYDVSLAPLAAAGLLPETKIGAP